MRQRVSVVQLYWYRVARTHFEPQLGLNLRPKKILDFQTSKLTRSFLREEFDHEAKNPDPGVKLRVGEEQPSILPAQVKS